MRGFSSIKGLALLTGFGIVMLVLFRFSAVDSGDRFPNSHDDIACSRCHTATASAGPASSIPDFNVQCRECHGSDPGEPAAISLEFHSTSNRQCTECHSFHDVSQITAGGREFTFGFGNRRMRAQCVACHGPGESPKEISKGHRAATRVFHGDLRITGHLTVSEACMVCHDQGGSRVQALDDVAAEASAPTFDPHGTHPVGMEVKAGRGEPGNRIREAIDPRLMLIEGRMECVTCHSLSARTPNRLVAYEDRDDMCRGCHVVG